MRKFFFLTSFILFINATKAQQPILPFTNISTASNILYKGVPNKMEVVTYPVGGKFSIQVDSGQIHIINGEKYITPKSTGKLSVTISTAIGQDKVSQTFYFESIELPNPKILLSKSDNGAILIKNKMSIKDIKEINKIDLSYNIKQISVDAQVKSFKIIGVTSKGKTKEVPSDNLRLKSDIDKILKQLNKGDFLLFKDIVIVLSNSSIEKMVDNVCIELE